MACVSRKLMMPRCDDCRKSLVSSVALVSEVQFDRNGPGSKVSGHGRIFSYVVYHRVYHPDSPTRCPTRSPSSSSMKDRE